MSDIDLSLLPAPEIVESLSYENILQSRKDRFIELMPSDQQQAMAATLELESEPITILLQENAYREMTLRQQINDAARALMLAYATGGNLDNIAVNQRVIRLAGESDADLRARTQLSPEAYSVAGPRLAYVFHALSADAAVRDVAAVRTSPGVVSVYVLADPSAEHPNGVPSAALLASVESALSADDIRPLNDEVHAEPATVLTYTIAARLKCQPGPDTEAVRSAAAVQATAYAEACFSLGVEVAISGIKGALHRPGVIRVDLDSPAAGIVPTPSQAALCTAVVVTIEAD